ncbi:hypothetical protein ACIPQJ_08520 [Streptomyces sp. NPDC090082]|uniref:hypothetical protein n=1 Tax=unclassified Streptomyces TaxID=2593676 RepID=UPI00382B8CC1
MDAGMHEDWPRGPWDRWGRGGGVPWRSTLLIAVFVLVGSGFAARNQTGREPLDAAGRALLLLGTVPLLFRHRRPVPVVFAVAAVTLGYLAAGYAYGPVFVMIAVACFAAVVHGHRTAAWWGIGLVWAGHLLLSHWLYRWLPPAGDGPAPWGQELPAAAFAVAVLAASEAVRVRREQRAQQRAERAAAERRRADAERLRPACGSGPRPWGAPSRRAPARTAASASTPCSRCARREPRDPRSARRRPVAGTGGVPRAARRPARHRGGR